MDRAGERVAVVIGGGNGMARRHAASCRRGIGAWSHLFVFYFGVVSDLTPPTAVSCYVAGGIAGESGMRVAFSATRVALVAGVLMVVPGLANAAVGFAMMAVVAVMHRRRRLHEAI